MIRFTLFNNYEITNNTFPENSVHDFNKWLEEAGTDNWRYTKYFMDAAKHAASISIDTSTKVGAVIVKNRNIIATGFNGFPCGVNDFKSDRYDRPLKYVWTEHAERNAIYQSAKNGTSLEGSTIYTTMFTCHECARAVIQSGIKMVISPFNDQIEMDQKNEKIIFTTRWEESFYHSLDMYAESGVKVILIGPSHGF